MKGLLLAIAAFSLSSALAAAAPVVNGLTGTPGNGLPLTLNVSGFCAHPNAPAFQKPTVFTDFEDGDIQPDEGKGLLSEWSNSNCMSISSLSAAEGLYAVRATIPNACQVEARLQIAIDWNLNEYLVGSVYRINTVDLDRSENWKHWRTSETGGNIYPNFAVQEPPDGGPQVYTEICSFGTHRQSFSYSKPNASWKADSLYLYRGTGETNATGFWKSEQDGEITGSSLNYSFNCAGQDNGAWDEFNVQDDLSNDNEGNSGVVSYDYVYIDTSTPCYVEFINSESPDTATKFWKQPYTAMAASSVTIDQHFANLGSNTAAIYARACNAGDCSEPVQLSSASGAPSHTDPGPDPDPRITGHAVIGL